MNLGVESFQNLQKKPQLGHTSLLLCENQNLEPRRGLPDFWPLEVWANKKLLFYAANLW